MQPHIYSQQQHNIAKERIDEDALFVIERLQDAGYTAYLVGGGVRDLLMGLYPKDFDISTSAKPEEIKKLFSNCLLIGRRFRLAHIRFGKKIFEVSTFRAGDTSEEGLILRDNNWGLAEEDVLRRDFTINGLFYDPRNSEIIDYVGGMHDLKNHFLRTIGDPTLRFKQDPVRMIRLLKFRARFGFAIDESAWHSLLENYQELLKSSSARIVEELLRMLESGHALSFFSLIEQTKILEILLSSLHKESQEIGKKELFAYLKIVDHFHKHHTNEKLDRTVLLAALVFPLLEKKLARISFEELSFTTVLRAAESILNPLFNHSFVKFTKRQRFLVEFILVMQQRFDLTLKTKKVRPKLLTHPENSKALQMLFLRSHTHESLRPLYRQWKEAVKQEVAPL